MIKERNSNIELLRIVCILFVIMHHVLVHGCGIYKDSVESYPWLLSFVNQLCYVAVNVFVLISGYFSIRFSWQKLIRIYLLCAIVGGMAFCLHGMIDDVRIGHSLIWNTILPFSRSPLWYIPVYICLFLIAPFLNIMLAQLNAKQAKWLIGTLLIISCYFGWFWHGRVNTDGFSLFQFVTMYCIGYCVNKFQIINRLRMCQWGGIWLIFASVCTILVYLQQTVLANMSFPPTPWIYAYNNPFLMAAAIGLFGMFARLSFQNKVINYIAKGTLGIYVIHENNYVHDWFFKWLEPWYNSSFVGVVLSVLCVFVISWLADWLIRMVLVNPILKLVNLKSKSVAF